MTLAIAMTLAYLLGAIYTFRYSGNNVKELTDNDHRCSNPFLHRCLNCGGDLYNHRKQILDRCSTPRYHPHRTAYIPGILFALLFMLTVPVYFVGQVNHARGKEFKFFKAPPVIESRQEKAERRLAEAQAEIAETNKRLEELGIDL